MLQTDNLPVKFMASRSRLAAQHDQERFAAGSGQRFAFFEIEDPATAARLRTATPRLSQQRGIGQRNDSKSQEEYTVRHERFPSSRKKLPVQTNQPTERIMNKQ